MRQLVSKTFDNHDSSYIKFDETASEEFTLERKAFDDTWLRQKISEGSLTSRAYSDLPTLKERLEHAYPGNWDIGIMVVNMIVICTYVYPPTPYTPYGAYFGYEDFDDYEYFMDNEGECGDGEMFHEEEKEVVTFYGFNPIIKFPLITISNSQELSREITDLYLKLYFRPTPISVTYVPPTANIPHLLPSQVYRQDMIIELGDAGWTLETHMSGCRNTITIAEYKASYAHSHLVSRNRESFAKWGNFCLGSGEIVQTFAMLREGFVTELFDLLLLQIDAYVRWESLEGNPHIKMSNVQAGVRLSGYPKMQSFEAEQYFTNLKQKLPRRQNNHIRWKVEDGQLRIIDDETFNDFCKTHQNFSEYSINYAFVFDTEGGIYNKSSASDITIPSLPNNDRYYFVYKGEKLTLNVVVNNPVQLNLTDFVIHPAIRTFIKKKLEIYANYNKVREDTINRATEALRISANTGQDQVPMQGHS